MCWPHHQLFCFKTGFRRGSTIDTLLPLSLAEADSSACALYRLLLRWIHEICTLSFFDVHGLRYRMRIKLKLMFFGTNCSVASPSPFLNCSRSRFPSKSGPFTRHVWSGLPTLLLPADWSVCLPVYAFHFTSLRGFNQKNCCLIHATGKKMSRPSSLSKEKCRKSLCKKVYKGDAPSFAPKATKAIRWESFCLNVSNGRDWSIKISPLETAFTQTHQIVEKNAVA